MEKPAAFLVRNKKRINGYKMPLSRLLIIGLFWLGVVFGASAQKKYFTQDAEAVSHVKKAMGQIYDGNFTSAKKTIQWFEKDYENHAVYCLLNYYLGYYQEAFKMSPSNENIQAYLAWLNKAEAQSEKMLEADSNNSEAVYLALASYAFQSLHYSEEKNYMKSAGAAKKAYKFVKDGFSRTEENPDFLLTSGLYDYYVVQYPETHPGMKPFMPFFKGGDKKRGLNYLKQAAQKGIFTQVEALAYLGHIYMRYEANYAEAVKWAAKLHQRHPSNQYFTARYAEALLQAKQFEEAKPLIDQLVGSKQEFFKMVGKTLNGWYVEKYLKDDELAQKEYSEAEKLGLKRTKLTFDYLGFCYAGLARISDRKGDKSTAKDYYKKTLAFSEIPALREEAKSY